MSREIFYIVEYNDCYGNGNNKKIEILIRKKSDFKKWLKEHNKMRDANPETEEEFNLIPINLFT